jgi:hypothetical protein
MINKDIVVHRTSHVEPALPAGRRSLYVMLSGVEEWLAQCHPSTTLRMTISVFIKYDSR